MFDVLEIAHTIIEEYNKKTNSYPTTFIIQKLLYYCQIFYMNQNENNLMFNDEILCSNGGPCILKISNLFSSFATGEIVLPQEYLMDYGVQYKKDQVVSIINQVFDYLGENVYKNYALLSDSIKTDENSAWKRQWDYDGVVSQQPISIKYLEEAASLLNV